MACFPNEKAVVKNGVEISKDAPEPVSPTCFPRPVVLLCFSPLRKTAASIPELSEEVLIFF